MGSPGIKIGIYVRYSLTDSAFLIETNTLSLERHCREGVPCLKNAIYKLNHKLLPRVCTVTTAFDREYCPVARILETSEAKRTGDSS